MKYYGLIMPSVFPTGVFIQDIKQTASSDESEGINTITVFLTNLQKVHFNVKNGKQGSSVEATAQMERHAKDYIAAELAGQKAALEQAIETGKADIGNSTTQAGDNIAALIQNKKRDFEKNIGKAVRQIEDRLQKAQEEFQALINTKAAEAGEDLNKKGESLIMTVKKEITEKITTEMQAFREALFYADAKEHIRIKVCDPKSFRVTMRVWSMRGAPVKTVNEYGETPDLPGKAPKEFFNGRSFFLAGNRASKITEEVVLEGNTVRSFYFQPEALNSIDWILIENCRFLEKIYAVGHPDTIKKFQITGSPRFKGFENIDPRRYNWNTPFYPEWRTDD